MLRDRTALRLGARAAFLLVPTILCMTTKTAGATQLATTTTLSASSTSVAKGAPVTLTATVKDSNNVAVTQGLLLFYDGKNVLGSGQIVTTGTKYAHGAAYLKVLLGYGAHSVTAEFTGTDSKAASISAARSLTVAGGTTSTTISSSGSANNYTLTSQVLVNGPVAATGSVNFLDQTAGDAQFATAVLGAGTLSSKFGTAAPYNIVDPNNWWSYEAVVADFNGDGFLDLAEAEYSDAGIYMGTGTGTFQAVKPFCMTTGTNPVHCTLQSSNTIHAADFNSDGIPDLVTGETSSLDVSLGKGDGTFQAPVHYATASGGDGVLVIADFNRDGIADIAQGVSGGVSILIGNGNGTFQPHTDTGVSGPGSGYLTVGDFNRDGIPDLVTTGWNSGSIAVLLGVGDGTFQAEKDTTIGVNPANPGNNPIVAADFKGTGYLADLALVGSNKLHVLIGKGDGTFPPKDDPAVQVYYPNGSSFYPYQGGVAVADWNGDGIQDIAMTWYSAAADAGRVALFYGKADGTFNATPKTINVGQQPVWVGGGDFNGDGSLDLVTVNENDSTLSVVLDTATNTATATVTGVSVPGVGTQNVYAQYPGTSGLPLSTSSTIALTGNGVAVPSLTSISPSSATVGGAAFTLTVNGSNFVSGNVVKWNGAARTTVFVSATKLTATILASDIAVAKTYSVRVATTGGVLTSVLPFTVTPVVTGPTITSLSPSSASVGGSAFTLTVNGTGFVTGAVVKWAGTARTTTFVSATKVTAAITAADIASAGDFAVTVAVGSSASNSVNFSVTSTSTSPTITAISPSYVNRGAAALTMTVTGTNFVSGAAVNWGASQQLTTTFVSTTKLTAAVPAANLTTVGTTQIKVGNPGGVMSNTVPFTVAPVTHTPIAYGFFNKDGSPGATSGNVSCTWTSPEYLCSITGEDFYYSKYVVNATIGDINTPAFITVNSISSKLIVKIYNPSGTAIQAPFDLVVFKP